MRSDRPDNSKTPYAMLPADLHQQIFHLMGVNLQNINDPSFFKEVKKTRLISRRHREALDNWLSRPEVVFYLISHLQARYTMNFIRFYRLQPAYRILAEKYATEPAVLATSDENRFNVLCYALATNNIYTVPWEVFRNVFAYFEGNNFAGLDEEGRMCLLNMRSVCNFVWYSHVHKEYAALQQLLLYLPRDGRDQYHYFNFAGANFDLSLAEFKHVPTPVAPLTIPANFDGVNFENANVSNVVFNGEELAHVNFQGANLRNTQFNGHTLRRIDFSHATMQGARLNDPDFDEEVGCRIVMCNFTGANLARAILCTNLISNTNFTDANLERANVTDVRFKKCRFLNARLDGLLFFNAQDLLMTNAAPTMTIFHNIHDNDLASYLALLLASAKHFRDVIQAWHTREPDGPAKRVLEILMNNYWRSGDCVNLLRSAIPEPIQPLIPPAGKHDRDQGEESDQDKRPRFK